MNHRIAKSLLLLSILAHTNLFSLSIVYNFRIAQITKQPIMENQGYNKNTIIALLLDQYSKTRNDTKQHFLGGLGAFIYTSKPYFFRIDWAVGHLHAKDHCTTTFNGTEPDDILFTLGHNSLFGDRKVLTASALFGVPTHQILQLKHASLGYGQFSLGAQIDGSYPIARSGALLGGIRYIRFFERHASDEYHARYRFTIGNVEDVLVAYKHSWPKHGAEVGYTSRVQFGAAVCPSFDDIVKKTNYVRSSFYAVYKYKFLVRDLPSRLLFNVAYGHDHRPHEYGNKYIVTLWGSWNINF
jgi:hypothetical protein